MTDAPGRLVALLIDDEVQIRRLLEIALQTEGYAVHTEATGQQGLSAAAFRRPDVVILDLGLPDMDGMEVLKRLREWSRVPVLVLTVRDHVDQKVAALDAGADDYLTKPFHPAELTARLRALRRHSPLEPQESVFEMGALRVDFAARQVAVGGRSVHLTGTEYALLRVLAQHAGKVVTHRQLLTAVWGPNAGEQAQYLRVYMNRLRKKLEPDPSAPRLMQTESGVGYRMVLQEG